MFSAGRTYGGAIAGTAWIGTPVADRIAATGRALTFTRRGRVFRGAMRRGDATVAGTRVA